MMQEAELLAAAIASQISDVNTACVARVESFDPIGRTVDAQPMVRRPVGAESGALVYEQLPIVPSCLVLYPSAVGIRIEWPLAPGDFVVLISTTLSIGQWRKLGKLADAGDVRQHHLGSSLALPLLPPPVGAGAVASGKLLVEAPTIQLGATATSGVANGEAVKAWLDAIVAAAGGPVTPPLPPFDDTSSVVCAKVLAE